MDNFEFDWKKEQIRQRIFADRQVAAFREYFEEQEPKGQAKIRELVERLCAIQAESRQLSLFLHVNVQREEIDDEGETVDWLDTTLKPDTMLMAIKAWEKGEVFLPSHGNV